MDPNLIENEKELAVYKAVCRLPLRVDEVEMLCGMDYSQILVEYSLDHCQANTLTMHLHSELRRYKMEALSGNRREDVTKLLEETDEVPDKPVEE